MMLYLARLSERRTCMTPHLPLYKTSVGLDVGSEVIASHPSMLGSERGGESWTVDP